MPPVKLFFCVIPLAGFLRLILHRNLKIALVLGVICIGVKGFFFGLRHSFFFSSIGFGILFFHQGQKIHEVDGLLSLGITVNDQIKSRTRLADQRDELLPAAIGIAGVVNNS
jgi:hypothetical protein